MDVAEALKWKAIDLEREAFSKQARHITQDLMLNREFCQPFMMSTSFGLPRT
jgi:hypothetical protein